MTHGTRWRRRCEMHPWTLWLFTALLAHRLAEHDPARPGTCARVIRMKGWRTALIETSWGQRCTVTYC